MNMTRRNHFQQPHAAVGPSIAALLDATPWSLRDAVGINHFVYHDGACLNLFRQATTFAHVAGPYASSHTINARVRQPDRFGFRFEGHDRQCWSECLLSHDLHAVIDICEHGWLVKQSGAADPGSPRENASATLYRVGNVVFYNLQLALVRHR